MTQLYVTGFDRNIQEEDVKKHFSQYGEVVKVRLHTPQPGKKGVAFVDFSDKQGAEAAIRSSDTLNGEELTTRLSNNATGQSASRQQGGPPDRRVGSSQKMPGRPMRTDRYEPYPQQSEYQYPPHPQQPQGYPGYEYGGYNQYYPYGGYPPQPAGGYPGGYPPYPAYPPHEEREQRYEKPRPKPARPANNNTEGGVNTDPATGNYSVFIYGIPPIADENYLNKLFAQYGKVANCKVIRDPKTNKSKGYGFVQMPSQSEANAAIQSLNGNQLADNQGVNLQVKFKVFG